MPTLQLPIGSYERYTGATTRLVNVFVEQLPAQGKGVVILNRAPGISALGTFSTSGFRGGVAWEDDLYAVVGGYLYKVDQTNAVTQIGAIAGSGRCSLAPGSTYLGINNNSGNAYTYDGTTLAAISDADFPANARGAAFIDDYMVSFSNGTDQFNASDLDDFTAWNALSFDNATGSDDDLRGVIAGQSKIYLGGERSTEIWWNAGLSPFPFQRVPNGVLDLGLAAQHTQAIIDNSICWYAHDGTVRVLRGLTPQRISNHAVESAFAGYADPNTAFAFAMTIGGHTWYVITFPGQATWVYDFNTNEWHQRETLGQSDWQVQGYVRAFNKDIAFAGNKFGLIDQDVNDEWGTEIQGQWTYPAVYGGGRRVQHKRFELRADVGTGNASVTTPLITLYISDDGGKTYTAMPTRSMGVVGNYKQPMIWTRLGSAKDRVYRCSMADPARLHVWATEVETDGGYILGRR